MAFAVLLNASWFEKFRISLKSETPCKVAAVIYCNSMLRSRDRSTEDEQVDGLLRRQVKMDTASPPGGTWAI